MKIIDPSSQPSTELASGQTHAEFERHWGSRLELFHQYLAITLEQALADTPTRLRDAISYSVLGPGKRLRPMLALLGAEAVGGEVPRAMPAAVAVELIHCYSLIHDDLPAMDDDDLRRGRPTCHVQFDEATAILAGDALQPLAFQLLSEGIAPPEQALKCCRYLARAAGPNALVGGQADDLAAEKGGGDAEMLARIHARKTGAMIECSAVIGALSVGAADSAIERLASYGRALGQAFQIIDDLLDVQGTADAVGKRVGKDCQRGKLTYPGIYGLDASRQAARDYTGKAVSAAEGFGAAGKLLSHLAKLYLERTH